MNLSNVTILITSFLRPGYLSDCIAGIKVNLPECPIIVVDDGGLSSGEIISLPFDSGLSAKRNRGVQATQTKYILMGSDDFDFSTQQARVGIERMVSVLETDESIDVAGGNVDGNRYEGNLNVVPGQYISQYFIPASPTGITPVDLVVNYFVARVESIRPYPWDERMKIGGEHGDWFLTLKDHGKKVVALTGVNITTQPYNRSKEDPTYSSFRGRAKTLGHTIFLRKRGVSQFYGADEIVPEPLKLPKFLVAIVSCHKNQARVEAQRNTWVPSLYKIDYRVFYGEGGIREPLSDEVFLNVKDDYLSLPAKMKEIYRWALDHGYEYIFKVDDDVFVEVSRLVPSGWQNAPYTGRVNASGSPPWASGACYWLNRQAMQFMVDEPLGTDTAEDRWVGSVLFKQGIHVHNDDRYSLLIYHQPDWRTAITACICAPNITMEMIAEGFEKGGSNAISSVLPPMAGTGLEVRPVSPLKGWQDTFAEKKVKTLFTRFRYVTETIPNSSHYKSLCRIYPKHLEEKIETPKGPRIIFVVEHDV